MPANDDDDDRPRKRPSSGNRRRDEDDDEDRPRKRRREDEEDDDRPRKRKRFEDDDDDYEDDRPRRGAKQGSNGLAVAGLVLGLLSFCTAGISGIPGGICAAIALGKPTGRGMAFGGLVASGLGILTWIVLGYLGYTNGVVPARERMKDSNNMKQIGLAFHADHDVNFGMSGPYARGNMGAPNTGLSFRVGLLPYVEQNALHKQFDMSQSWNSPKNQSASNTKLAVFTAPGGDELASTNTPYRVFYGGGALFNEDGKPVRLTDISDGTSNTIMMVHATDQVPWAEPREFKYSDKMPLPKLGPPNGKGGNVLMADGSVRFLPNTVSERTLRLAITRADGMPLPLDW